MAVDENIEQLYTAQGTSVDQPLEVPLVHTSRSQETLVGKITQSSSRQSSHPLADVVEGQRNGTFFCPYCKEEEPDKPTSFKRKDDWKKHLEKYHETGYVWECQEPNCESVFSRDQKLKEHAKKNHRKPSVRGVKVDIPVDRVHACGFRPCRKLSDTWRGHYDHVARCMFSSDTSSEWSYTWKILNLMRHPRIHETWKGIKYDWTCRGLDLSQLNFDCVTTRTFRRQLECHDFTDLKALLELLLKSGLTGHAAPNNFFTNCIAADINQGLQPSVKPVSPFHPGNATYTYTQGMQPSFMTYADQRHPNSFGNINRERGSNDEKRNSVMMVDAPSDGPANDNDPDLQTFNQFIASSYSTNTTPPLSSSYAEPSAHYDTRARRRKLSWKQNH